MRTRTHPSLPLNLALSLILLSSPVSWAAPFSELVVFGDTLSDTGNAAARTLGVQPGPYYFEGRFTNGPVYAERLAEQLGLPPLAPSAMGGQNFAFGGAQTSGTGGLLGAIIEDVDEQVDEFLARGPAEPTALIVMLAGANDLFGGQMDVDVPVDNVVGSLQRLISARAESFLVLNLPPLGSVPRYRGDPAQATVLNELTRHYNASLDTALDELQLSAPDIQLFRFDVAGLFEEMTADPELFDLVNVVDPAAPDLFPGAASYDSSQIVAEPDRYLFWDELHPTAAVHELVAERTAEIVPEPSGLLLLVAALFALVARGRISHAVP